MLWSLEANNQLCFLSMLRPCCYYCVIIISECFFLWPNVSITFFFFTQWTPPPQALKASSTAAPFSGDLQLTDLLLAFLSVRLLRHGRDVATYWNVMVKIKRICQCWEKCALVYIHFMPKEIDYSNFFIWRPNVVID